MSVYVFVYLFVCRAQEEAAHALCLRYQLPATEKVIDSTYIPYISNLYSTYRPYFVVFVDYLTERLFYGKGCVYLFTHHVVIDSYPKGLYNPLVLPYVNIDKLERVRICLLFSLLVIVSVLLVDIFFCL